MIIVYRSTVLAVLVGILFNVGIVAQATEPEAKHYPAQLMTSAMYPDLYERHRELVGKPMPWVELHDWQNGTLTPEELEGKVVLIDFFATWCAPCLAAIPKLNDLQEKYEGEGLVVLSICTSQRGQDLLEKVIESFSPKFVMAKDTNFEAMRKWHVIYYPMYAIVGRDGIVKAVGVKGNRLEEVLLAELSGEGAAKFEDGSWRQQGVPEEFIEGDSTRITFLDDVMMQPLPPLNLDGWVNSAPLTNNDLEGKIVVLNFWTTWDKVALDRLPANDEIAGLYRDKGVVFIGVAHPSLSDKIPGILERYDVAYPIAVDTDSKLAALLGVDDYPDYYIIDRKGKIWGPDVHADRVIDALEMLLTEETNTAEVE